MTALMLLFALACAGWGSDPETPPAPVPHADASAFPDAPAVGTLDWVKGDEVDFTKGVVVVEMWATWCGPCRDQFPHLSHLQAEHAGTLTVVGLTDEHPATVKPFVKKHAEDMGFTVAVDGSGATYGRWTTFANVGSIPHAFLVKDGHVLWHGHPMGLDPVLEAALAGTWTPEMAQDLDDVTGLRLDYHRLLSEGHDTEARAAGERVLALATVAPGMANDLAWEILTEVPTEHRDLDLALKCAEAAAKATGNEDHNILDTYALALYESGRAAEAATVQKKAVELCKAASDSCGDFEERLHQFERG